MNTTGLAPSKTHQREALARCQHMSPMNPKPTFLSLAFTALLVAPPCLAQADDPALAQAEELVTGLVDPAAPANVVQAASVTGSLKDTVSKLLEAGDVASIRLIGDAAIPALEELVREASVMYLLKGATTAPAGIFARGMSSHPIVALSAVSPTRGVEFVLELQESDPERFDLLRRSGYTPLSKDSRKSSWNLGSEASKAAATQMLNRALENAAYSKGEKLKMACVMFERGLETESSRKLIADNLDAAIDNGLGDKGFQEFLIGSGDVAQLSPKQGIALARSTSDEALLLALVGSPHVRVRRGALERIRANELSDAIHTAAVTKALDDSDGEVAYAIHALVVHGLANSNVQLSRTFLIRIAEFYGRVQLSDTDETGWLRSMIMKSIMSARTEDELAQVEQLVKAVFEAPLKELQQGLRNEFLRDMDAPRIAAAVYRGLVASDSLSPGSAQQVLESNRPSRQSQRANYFLDVYTAHDPASDSVQLPYQSDDLAALPKERYSEALDWLGRTGANFDHCCGMDPGSWTDGADAFRLSAYDETAPWKERAMAIIALFSSLGVHEEDGVRCGDILGKELGDLEQRELFLKLMGIRNSAIEMPLSRHWNSAVARIYAAAGVPSGVKEQLPLSYAPTDPTTLQKMLNTAGAETAQEGTTRRFEALAYLAAPLAAQGTLRIPDALLTNWLRTNTTLDSLVTFILAGEQAHPKTHYRDMMLEALGTSDNTQTQILVEQILRFSDEETVAMLIDAATKRNHKGLIQSVQIQVGRLVALRDLRSQWTATEEIPTKSSAILELLGLLKSDSEVVRLEAIRGLGTLGAVEALPQLIGIAGSGTEGERARALEVLAYLNERSMTAPIESK